ncbi:MAG: DUF4332 domain-containing protein [Candidatus Hodarchaeota archaeon]
MDERGFRKFLKQKSKTPQVVDRVVKLVQGFQSYLKNQVPEKLLNQAESEDLEAYVIWVEQDLKESAKTPLWALGSYFEYTKNHELVVKARKLREQRTARQRKPYLLKKFMGVNPDYIEKLAELKIRDVKQMIQHGRTPQQRQTLAKQTAIPIKAIEDLVSLSDLSRLPGIKSIRARLYVDMGVQSIPMMAQWNPEELRLKATEFVTKTGFKGIPPLPKEVANAVEKAKSLSKLVEW